MIKDISVDVFIMYSVSNQRCLRGKLISLKETEHLDLKLTFEDEKENKKYELVIPIKNDENNSNMLFMSFYKWFNFILRDEEKNKNGKLQIHIELIEDNIYNKTNDDIYTYSVNLIFNSNYYPILWKLLYTHVPGSYSFITEISYPKV